MRKTWIVGAAVVAAALVQCGARYKPLDVADSCACRTSEFCSVSAGHTACHPLPLACGAKPSCDCVGSRNDACRDEDGRLTLFPTREVRRCDECGAQEYCSVGSESMANCRVLPPECEGTPTCACFLGNRGRSAHWACSDRSGHIVASAR
jgi:hypothetical protein